VNLAYLMVTVPMLVARLRRRGKPVLFRRGSLPADAARAGNGAGTMAGGLFSMGRLGLAVNLVAVVWGVFIVLNIGWPRPEVYGSDPWGRFAAPMATLALIGVGTLYYRFGLRKNAGILAEHATKDKLELPRLDAMAPALEAPWLGRLAAGD
jgi:hypothetical protein